MPAMTIFQTPFPLGWQHYLLGGLCVGGGVALLFALTGRIGGMSTVFSSTWSFVLERPFFRQARLMDTRGWAMAARRATAFAAWARCNGRRRWRY